MTKIPIYEELDRLKAENKELRDAIHYIVNTWYGRMFHDDVMDEAFDKALKIANGG